MLTWPVIAQASWIVQIELAFNRNGDSAEHDQLEQALARQVLVCKIAR